MKLNPFFQSPSTVGFKGKYKYVRNYEPERADELFDVESDIGEQTNLSKTHPEMLMEMSKQMDQWIAENDAALPKPLKAKK